MASNVSMKFDTSGISAALDKLGDGLKGQVRPAAQAGAQELYDEVKANVAKLGRVTGNLDASIYQVFSKDNSPDGRATYHVSWNASKAPHAHLLENGTSRAPAYPFLRPAYDARAKQALDAAKAKMTEGAQKLIAGLET